MPFLIFGLLVIIMSIIAAYRNRHTRLQQKTDEDFWERELAANSVRRQDISDLPYINIPFELFSIGSLSDDALKEAADKIETFHGKKILNLGSQTNTDIKLQYGPANLQTLSECDQNFADMLLAITAYTNRLIELEQIEKAIPILEFCIASGSDITAHYTTLAQYYKSNGADQKFAELKAQAESLDSIMKTSILNKIDAIWAES